MFIDKEEKNFKLKKRNYTLAIAVKKHAKVDIKHFLSRPTLNILCGIIVFILVQIKTFYPIEST